MIPKQHRPLTPPVSAILLLVRVISIKPTIIQIVYSKPRKTTPRKENHIIVTQ